MKSIDQKKAAKEFAERWKDKGYEKGESQKYWIDLLENVLGISDAIDFIKFEDTVHIDKATGFIHNQINQNLPRGRWLENWLYRCCYVLYGCNG